MINYQKIRTAPYYYVNKGNATDLFCIDMILSEGRLYHKTLFIMSRRTGMEWDPLFSRSEAFMRPDRGLLEILLTRSLRTYLRPGELTSLCPKLS